MKFLSILFSMALVASSVFAEQLTVTTETILQSRPETGAPILLVVKKGETGPVLGEFGEYSLVTVKTGQVKLAINSKSTNEGWIWDGTVVWTGNDGVCTVDSALCQGPYLAGHDILIGAVKAQGTLTRIKVDAWWVKTKIRGVEGWIFRTVITRQ